MDARTWYVKTTGSGADGSSWATAVSLTQALGNAQPLDEIWVAAGTYKPDAADRTIPFVIPNGVNIYGGFAGTESNLTDRNPVTNATILSGDLTDNDVANTPATYADNSLHVVATVNTLSASTLIDGFTIKSGYANQGTTFLGTTLGNLNGAGIFCSATGGADKLTISNCIFNSNAAAGSGAALAAYTKAPTLKKCTFSNNGATSNGGALFYSGTGVSAVDTCTFLTNVAANGGAVNLASASPVYKSCVFTGNTATAKGGAMRSLLACAPVLIKCTFRQNTAATNGGAIDQTSARLTATDCLFDNNSSTSGIGGAVSLGTAPALTQDTILNCVFTSNRAMGAGGSGGALAITTTSPTILRNSIFTGNSAGVNGGAIMIAASKTLINACFFQANTAVSNGGAITTGTTLAADSVVVMNSVFNMNAATSPNSTGGAIIVTGSISSNPVKVTNCTFNDNVANDPTSPGTALKADGSSSSLTVTNSVIWSATAATVINTSNAAPAPTATYSYVKGTYLGTIYPGTGNKNELTPGATTPGFSSAATPFGADGIWGTLDDGLMLACTSPCKDAGNAAAAPALPVITADIVGSARPQGVMDMGAYEYPSAAGSVTVTIAASRATLVCADTTITFTPTPTSVIGTPSYAWKRNGTTVFSGSPYVYSSSSAATEPIVCEMTTCSGTYTSNTINVTVQALPIVTLPASICLGGGALTPTINLNGGTLVMTNWKANGTSVASTATYTPVAVGNHTVTLTTTAGCVATSNATPVVDVAVTLSGGFIACNGGTAIVTATATGGLGAYEYNLDGGAYQYSNVFSGVGTGYHTIVARDMLSLCTKSGSIVITEPSALTISSPVSGSITCNGGTTTLSTMASGGTMPYEYKLNAGTYQPSNVFTASAGSNTLTARDGNGCTQTATVTLVQPTAITNTIASSNIACNGGNATITATATGGTGILQYSIDGINYQAANTFTRPAGTYAVTAKDDNGCTRLSNSLTISQPAVLSVSIAPAATIPSNGTTTLTATATGGTTPYSYSLNGGAAQASNLFTIPAGRDSVRVTDANGCAQLSSTVIIANMVVSATKTLLCAGVSDTFRATPTNAGTTPVYQWKKNNVNVGTNSATYVDAGLVNGDVVRCDMTASAPSYAMTVLGNSITVTVETQPTATITPASSCMGTPLTATLSNGTFSTAVWMNNLVTIAGVSTANYTSTAGGSHTARITTVAGCVVTSSTAAVYQVALTINNGNAVKVLCNGGTAGISVVGSGGVAPYQYSLDGGAFSTNNLFTVNAGTYTITGKDANGCTKVSTIVVTEPPVLTVDDPIAWPIACFGGTTVLSASARGGNNVYQYSLDGFNYQSTINFTVRAGVYQVIVRDSNGCSAASNLVRVNEPGDLIPTATQSAIACIGGTATVTMGTRGGTAPFTYSFNGSPFGTNRVFTNVAAGTYTLSVIDTNLCTKTVNFTVTQPTAVNGSIKVDTIICINTNTQLVVTGTGGTGALSYSLNGGTPQGNAFTVQAGTFNIVISDVNGCKKVLPPVKVYFAQTWAGNTQAVPINCLENGLLATYPNPANESVTIDFKIPSKSVVVLKIYDMMGRLIQTMDQGTLKGGAYTSRWSTGNLDDATVLICLEVDGVCIKNQKVRIIKR
jgi:hypothetical protein